MCGCCAFNSGQISRCFNRFRHHSQTAWKRLGFVLFRFCAPLKAQLHWRGSSTQREQPPICLQAATQSWCRPPAGEFCSSSVVANARRIVSNFNKSRPGQQHTQSITLASVQGELGQRDNTNRLACELETMCERVFPFSFWGTWHEAYTGISPTHLRSSCKGPALTACESLDVCGSAPRSKAKVSLT